MIEQDWSPLIASWQACRVLVVGDVMVDEYLCGEVRRVCPEAPIPVVEVKERWAVPGGAANAAANVVALGGRPLLGGVTGEDLAANELIRETRARTIDVAGLIVDPARPTTVKVRAIARGQQVARLDTESTVNLPSELSNQLAAWAECSMALVDAVLLSDYGKGVVDNVLAGRIISAARKAGRPVVVDPKGSDVKRYRGATVIKPNLSELSELSHRSARSPSELHLAAQSLAEELHGSTILVTRGEEGMALFQPGQRGLYLAAAPARRVYDVTGAGDTAAATLTLALGAGLGIETAVQVANVAAGLAVSKVGTAVVTPDELIAALIKQTSCFVPMDT